MTFLPHQQELLNIARLTNVLLCGEKYTGKTFCMASVVRDFLQMGGVKTQKKIICIVPSMKEMNQNIKEITRVCGIQPITCHTKANEQEMLVQKWEQDETFVQEQLTKGSVLVLVSRVFQALLKKNVFSLGQVSLLILKEMDQIHSCGPSFCPLICQQLDSLNNQKKSSPRIVVTSNQPVSRLYQLSSNNPLFFRIQVLHITPVLPNAVTQQPFAPIFPEPFYSFTEKSAVPIQIQNARDFLAGGNRKSIDLIKFYRMALDMGNSAAIYDEKKKQTRVNRFISDAEAVYTHLGLWCFLKYIENELQTSLHACLQQDEDNINHQRKLNQEQEQVQKESVNIDHTDENNLISEKIEAQEEDEVSFEDLKTFEEVVEERMEHLNEEIQKNLRSILKVISWVGREARTVGVSQASPRLSRAAEIVKSHFVLYDKDKQSRVWVALQRRCHCRVVTEYLTAYLAELQLPPACSMLGNSSARIAGLYHFSSQSKVFRMFSNYATRLMVTTSIHPDLPIDRFRCQLVVVMDELQEPQKLWQFGRVADPRHGVIKLLVPNSPACMKKFELLNKKLNEFIQMDLEQRACTRQSSSTVHNGAVNGNTGSSSLSINSNSSTITEDSQSAKIVYEVFHQDTRAKLTLENAIQCLAEFCDTLPGIDTYDRRPQYMVKRHAIITDTTAVTEFPWMKQNQNKKQKKKHHGLLDSIDAMVSEANEGQDEEDSNTIDGEDDEENGVEDEQVAENNSEKKSQSVKSSQSKKESRYLYSATVRPPLILRIKKQFVSPKVATDEEAKSIAAFKTCLELLKKGFLDRNFKSKLSEEQEASIHTAAIDVSKSTDIEEQTKLLEKKLMNKLSSSKCPNQNGKQVKSQLQDLTTQDSYDLPPISAHELSLAPVRSLFETEGTTTSSKQTFTMYLYRLEPNHRVGILCSNALDTGDTNMSWRYNFARSDVLTTELFPVALQKTPLKVEMTRNELQQALHFHLLLMRLVCMGVEDAEREISIQDDQVWKEFSQQNDKGYLVVPTLVDQEIDWEYLKQIVSTPLIQPMEQYKKDSFLPIDKLQDAVFVTLKRKNVVYAFNQVWPKGDVSDVRREYVNLDEEAWNHRLKKGRSRPGEPILGRWYVLEELKKAIGDQPMLHLIEIPSIAPLIRRVIQRNNDTNSIAQRSLKFKERLVIPQYTGMLSISKDRYFEAMGLVPLLYEFERKCQMYHLMKFNKMEIDMVLLDEATSKPAYERLEILGDTFLKLETSWFLYQTRKDITEEGNLTRLRRDIIRNDRLTLFARKKRIHHYMLHPAAIEQHPFRYWKPSCMGNTPEAVVVSNKWIADVLEAMCGAYLVGKGEDAAREFLKWTGIQVLDQTNTFDQSFYPHCFPNERDGIIKKKSSDAWNFDIDQFDELAQQLQVLEKRLKYTFTNKFLLLEAVTHPTVGRFEIVHTNGHKEFWKGNYERLEYLGDAIIEYLTLAYAFVTYEEWLPGSLSQWKSSTVSNDALGKTAIACFGIDECICIGNVRVDQQTIILLDHIERKYPCPPQRRTNSNTSTSLTTMSLPKMFADVFEALVAAVFLDSGHDLHTVRDVFMGPLLSTIGQDALAYVCQSSGLSLSKYFSSTGSKKDGTMNENEEEIEELVFTDEDEDA